MELIQMYEKGSSSSEATALKGRAKSLLLEILQKSELSLDQEVDLLRILAPVMAEAGNGCTFNANCVAGCGGVAKE
jgi:hypothetical protein